MTTLKDLVVAGNFEELDKIETASSSEGKQYQKTITENTYAPVLQEFEKKIVIGKYLKILNDFKENCLTEKVLTEIKALGYTSLEEYVQSGLAAPQLGVELTELRVYQNKYQQAIVASQKLSSTAVALSKSHNVERSLTTYPSRPPMSTKLFFDTLDYEVSQDANQYLVRLINIL